MSGRGDQGSLGLLPSAAGVGSGAGTPSRSRRGSGGSGSVAGDSSAASSALTPLRVPSTVAVPMSPPPSPPPRPGVVCEGPLFMANTSGEGKQWYCVLTKGLLVSYSSKQLALAEDGQYDGAAGAVDMTLAVVCAEMDISTCVPLSLVREFGFQMQQNSKGFMCYAETLRAKQKWMRCLGEVSALHNPAKEAGEDAPSSNVSDGEGSLDAALSDTFVGSSALEGTGVIMQGYLSKCNRAGRFWKNRWCVLRPHVLAYYEREEDAAAEKTVNEAAYGLVDLEGALVVEDDAEEIQRAGKGGHLLVLDCPTRMYQFVAKTEEEKAAWKAALRRAVG